MEINNSVYYPITPYHLICSTILRFKFKSKFNVLILDSNLFDQSLIKNIRDSNNWNKVIIIKNSSKYLTSLNSNRHLDDILIYINEEIYNVFYFSPGINTCNLFINKLNIKHKLFLCDDGLAPYYFNQSIFYFWEKISKKNRLRNIFHKLIYIFTTDNYQFIFKKNVQLIILNKDLSELIIDEHVLLNVENAEKLLALIEVKFYYSNLLPLVTNKFKIVFFHSDNNKLDLTIYSELLKKYPSQEIFHCYRQRTNHSNSILHLNNNNVPWEILHHHYLQYFNDSILVSLNFTTAFINTVNPHILNNKRFIVNKNYFNKPTLFDGIVRLINQISQKPISFISSIEDF